MSHNGENAGVLDKDIKRRPLLLSEQDQSLGRLDQSVFISLRRIDRVLGHGFHKASANLNARSGTISCLALIATNPGVSQKLLAANTGFDKSIIVGIMDDLESRGWAIRVRSTEDRRRHALQATDAGLEVLRKVEDEIFAFEDKMLEGFDKESVQTLLNTLDAMYMQCAGTMHQFKAES